MLPLFAFEFTVDPPQFLCYVRFNNCPTGDREPHAGVFTRSGMG